MNYSELIEQSNARVLELNKSSQALEAVAFRMDLIQREGNYIVIGQGDDKPVIQINDLISDEDQKRIMTEIIKAISDRAAEKQRHMEELLGIRPTCSKMEPVADIPSDATQARQKGAESETDILSPKANKAENGDVAKRQRASASEINNLFAAGCTNEEVAAGTGLKISSVIKYRTNYNKFGNASGEVKDSGAAVKPEPVIREMNADEIKKMVKEGTPLKDIAVYYGVKKPDVYQFCQKHHIPTTKEYAR